MDGTRRVQVSVPIGPHVRRWLAGLASLVASERSAAGVGSALRSSGGSQSFGVAPRADDSTSRLPNTTSKAPHHSASHQPSDGYACPLGPDAVPDRLSGLRSPPLPPRLTAGTPPRHPDRIRPKLSSVRRAMQEAAGRVRVAPIPIGRPDGRGRGPSAAQL